MTFGEHLEELRTRMIRSLIGIFIAVSICLYFGNQLLEFILHSVRVVLTAQGTPANLLVLAPPEGFIQYLKVSVVCGLALAGPWVLGQAWLFVAAGLYPHEQKFVRYFAPASMVLFVAGVGFMFYFVLPVVLQFLSSFALNNIPMPDRTPTAVEKALLKLPDPPALTTQPAPWRDLPIRTEPLPSVVKDPEAEPSWTPGDMWYDQGSNELRVVNANGEIFRVSLHRMVSRSAVTTQYRLSDYISFVLALSLAFGIAFQVPLVVVFVVLLGIFRVKDLARARRYVIFGIVITAAMLTPPDVVSQLLLAGPMILLFELGLLVGRVIERGRPAEEAA